MLSRFLSYDYRVCFTNRLTDWYSTRYTVVTSLWRTTGLQLHYTNVGAGLMASQSLPLHYSSRCINWFVEFCVDWLRMSIAGRSGEERQDPWIIRWSRWGYSFMKNTHKLGNPTRVDSRVSAVWRAMCFARKWTFVSHLCVETWMERKFCSNFPLRHSVDMCCWIGAGSSTVILCSSYDIHHHQWRG